MPLVRSLCLVPLMLGAALLNAEDTEPKESHHHHHHSEFGVTVQVNVPHQELKDALDGRTGYGVGLQWTHDHGNYNASRTRLDFNVFPEGNPVGPAGVKTYAKNTTFSFDHLFLLGNGRHRPYLVAGVGGVNWVLEQYTGPTSTDIRTTKLAFTGGLGIKLADRVNLEARYVFSGIQNTFDSNVTQFVLGWHF